MLKSNNKNGNLKPLIKWPGGKEKELKYIIPEIPKKYNNFYEPFVGGGAVFFSLRNFEKKYINDKSHELIELYKKISSGDDIFFNSIYSIAKGWNKINKILIKNKDVLIQLYKNFSENKIEKNQTKSLIKEFINNNYIDFINCIIKPFDYNIDYYIKEIKKNFYSKIVRMNKIELLKGKLPEKDILDNIECSFKSAFYMYFRYLYNNFQKYNISESIFASIFYFIRIQAYASMFRYNSKGEFNVPYGGIAYNNKDIIKQLNYFKSEKLKKHFSNTVIENLDFENFFIKYEPRKNDFIFLDPPYDTDFSTYANNKFNKDSQKRLAEYLIKKCKAKWLLVIKNTEYIFNLYNKNNINITSFDKKYLVSFRNRNDKQTEHLIIKNY